jgi:hypothetical protein
MSIATGAGHHLSPTDLKRTSWLLLACAALLHLGFLVGWRWQYPVVPYFFDATVLSGGRGLDFYSIYQAGYNARHGWDIYEADPARVTVVVPYFTPYRYLPGVAYTVGAALSLLAPLTAYKAWVVILELTLLGCCALTWRRTRSDPDLAARLVAMWLAFTPFYLELFMGQFSLIQAALLLGLLLAIAGPPRQPQGLAMRGRPAQSADALWIASVLWKINTVVFAPLWLRLGRWRAVAVMIGLVVLTTLPYFLVFPAHAHDLLTNNFGRGVASHELGNLGFRQLVFETLAAGGASPGLQRALQLAVIGLVGGLSLALTWLRPQAPVTALVSLWLAAYFLASPQVWEHHYLMLLPAIIVAYRAHPGWVLAGAWLLLALPTPFGFIGLQPVIAGNHDLRAFALEPAWQPLLQHLSKALPAMVLFGYWARQVFEAGSTEASGIIPLTRQ